MLHCLLCVAARSEALCQWNALRSARVSGAVSQCQPSGSGKVAHSFPQQAQERCARALGAPFPADAMLCVFACVQIDVDFLWAMARSAVRVAQELVRVVTSAMTSARGTLRRPRVSMLGAG